MDATQSVEGSPTIRYFPLQSPGGQVCDHGDEFTWCLVD